MMKKIIALGLAVAGAVWALSKSRGEKPKDVWVEATDQV
jgi:hypothetical protein